MNKLKEITKEIQNAGGKVFIVGGFVRDLIMGQPNYKDIDVEVFNIAPETLENILTKFGSVKFCGKSFGAYKLENYDFSFPRREVKNGTGHKGFDIEIDPYMSFKEAASRRDLTINSLMMNPITEEIHDYFGGQYDIEHKILQHVSHKFSEDPLRVLRVAQFAGRFSFNVDPNTFDLCSYLVRELRSLPKERIYTEIEKLLMLSPKPSVGFNFLYRMGVMREILPELYSLYFVEQGRDHHSEGSVWNHTMLMLDSVPLGERNMQLMLSILVHDLGKMVVENEIDGDSIHFKGHAEEGLEISENLLRRMTNEENLINDVLTVTKYHMRPYELKNVLNKKLLRRLALKVDIPSLMRLHQADLEGRGDIKDTSHIKKFLDMYEEVKNEIKPLITGKHLIDLGLKPGKHFGGILDKIFDRQLEDEFSTVEEGLKWLKLNWDIVEQKGKNDSINQKNTR